MGGGSGTQLGGAMGGDTGSWWSLDDGPDSWRPRPAALRDLRIISLRRSLERKQNKMCVVILEKITPNDICGLLQRLFFLIDSLYHKNDIFLPLNGKFTLGYWRSQSYFQSCCLRPQRWHWQSPLQQTDALQMCFSPTFQLLK